MSKRNTSKIRDGFTFYRSFRDAVEMTDKSDQLILYKAIADYALDGTEPDISTLGALGRLCWTAISPNIKSGRKNFENGCNGGAPKGNSNAKKQPKNNPDSTEKQPGETSNENVNENENVNVNENGDKNRECEMENVATKRRAFVAPTLAELQTYISEKGFTNVNAEQFIDHYTANGWNVGKSPMKDWQAAVRNWNRRDLRSATNLTSTTNETQGRYEALL